MKPSLGIYVHIPFCASKCYYCDFTSFEVKDPSRSILINSYVNALKQEIELYQNTIDSYDVRTLYLGGGTPSLLEPHLIKSLFSKLPRVEEVTIEVNPGTLTHEKIEAYIEVGINRISLGLQSRNDSLLKNIGRGHNFSDSVSAYKTLRDYGFTNISLDFMFGLPNQTFKDLNESLESIRQLNPEHVSVYSLKIEEGTPFYSMGELNLPDEEQERLMYHHICKQLEILGYYQYEISNFSKPGYESKHNLMYWENKSYLGLGISAHGKINKTRYANVSSINDYTSNIAQLILPIENTEVIDEEEDLFETIMLGLRLNKGINIDLINSKYGIDFETKYQVTIHQLILDQLISVCDKTIMLTPLGRDVSNRVFVAFL